MAVSDLTRKRYEGKPHYKVYYLQYEATEEEIKKKRKFAFTEFFGLVNAIDFIDSLERLGWTYVKCEHRPERKDYWEPYWIENHSGGSQRRT